MKYVKVTRSPLMISVAVMHLIFILFSVFSLAHDFMNWPIAAKWVVGIGYVAMLCLELCLLGYLLQLEFVRK